VETTFAHRITLQSDARSLLRTTDVCVSCFPRVEQVTIADQDSLPLLNAFIKETLRLYPPGPFYFTHKANEDIVYGTVS